MNNRNAPQTAASRRRWITIGSLAAVGIVTFLLAHSKGQYDALYPVTGAGSTAQVELSQGECGVCHRGTEVAGGA